MNKWFYILILTGLCSCYLGEEMPPDQEVWTYTYPTNVGLNDQSLYDLDQAVKDEAYGLITSMIIVKDDQIAFENYYNFSERAEKRSIGRVTFPILTLTLDLFIKAGYIELDEPIQNYLPEYEEVFVGDSLKQLITVRDLISFKSGLVWNEVLSFNNDLSKMQNTSDWVGYVLSKPMEAPPGYRAVVNSGLGMVLARILQNQLEGQNLKDYLQTNFFSRIGIKGVEWSESPDSVLNATNGLLLSAIDLTRIGYLMLNEGRWTGKQRVISRDWVLDITTEHTEVDNSYSFGFNWWLFSDSFSSNWLDLPDNTTFFASGETGQNLYVIPSKNMVVCITAQNYSVDFYNPSLSLFVKSLESLQPALAN